MIPWRVKNLVSEKAPLLYHAIVNRGFSRHSEAYWDNAFDVSWRQGSRQWPVKNRLVELLVPSSSQVLDVGCGTGSLLLHLKSKGYEHLSGFEISRRAVEVLGQHGITMYQGRLPHLTTPDGTFDTVIASQVLEHVVRRRFFLNEICRTLKPDGVFLGFVPDNCLGPIDEPSHVTKFNKNTLEKLMLKHFSSVFIRSIRDDNFEMPVLFAYARLGTAGFTDGEVAEALAESGAKP